ncbi:MAG: MarR family winged helix-turn-helix transcriptional regulator [Streptosporangiaceae bacterium]
MMAEAGAEHPGDADPGDGGPAWPPVGLQLNQAAREIGRAFDAELARAGGSLPAWLVLLAMKTSAAASQRELAVAVGIREATLTHHLNAMERAGLLTRRRDPANRRVHIVELTAAGEETFGRLRATAIEFDGRLRRGLTDEQIGVFGGLLRRLAENAGVEPPGAPPWTGLDP